MHVIAPHRPRVTLFGHDGSRWHFDSIDHARKELGFVFIRDHVGPHFVVAYRTHTIQLAAMPQLLSSLAWKYERYDFVMRDDTGRVLLAEDFAKPRRRWRSSRERLLENWIGIGPVPGTGKWRRKSYFRSMSHMNARRASACFEDEGEVPVRGKRSLRNLPNPWDDYYCASEKNWKSQRDRQWKKDQPSCRSLWHEGFFD